MSAPEPETQVHYCDQALSVVRRSSLFKFATSLLKSLNKIQRKQILNVLYSVRVFRTDRKSTMAALSSDWLKHFRILLWDSSTEFNDTWQEAKFDSPLPSLCFSGKSEKQDGLTDLWLVARFLTSSLKPLNITQRNLTGSNILTSSTRFVFFEQIEKDKTTALVSELLRNFRLLLWNRWIELIETWPEARSQRPLPSFCFRADWKTKRYPAKSAKKVAHCTQVTICSPWASCSVQYR